MDKIKAKLVVEIMGRPAEHVKETLRTVLLRLKEEKGISLIESKEHEPIAVKDAENLYTSFVEIDAEFDTLQHFLDIIMGYMPSHVEIYEPEKFKWGAADVNSMSNFIISRLHRFDEIVKRITEDRDILYRQLEYLKKGGDIKALMPPKKDEEEKSDSEEGEEKN